MAKDVSLINEYSKNSPNGRAGLITITVVHNQSARLLEVVDTRHWQEEGVTVCLE